MSKNSIILSAATIASAVSALAQIGQNGGAASISNEPGQFSQQVNAALLTSQSQRILQASIPPLSHSIRSDGKLLSETYFEIADERYKNWDPQHADSEIDSRLSQGGTYNAGFNCYTNCHNACHGSRGWR